ncbi:hypothetical protein BH09PSE4_BH09PSE4_19590 [soil metagenome]
MVIGLCLLAAASPAFAMPTFIACTTDRSGHDKGEETFFSDPEIEPFIWKIDDTNIFMWKNGWIDDICTMGDFTKDSTGEHGQCTETVTSRSIILEAMAPRVDRHAKLTIDRTTGTFRGYFEGLKFHRWTQDTDGTWTYSGKCAPTADPELALPKAAF